MRILIVDDSAMMRAMIKRVIKLADVSVGGQRPRVRWSNNVKSMLLKTEAWHPIPHRRRQASARFAPPDTKT